jgi:PhzF family phenazine biosynthesis protein
MPFTVDVHIVHAFDRNGGGNPAGVVLDADTLTPQQMQAVARAAGLSETAFVSRSSIADFKLDFFTPVMRIAHCGHATIATFSYLRQLGRVQPGPSSKETVDGRREILIQDNAAFMEQQAPYYADPCQQHPLVTRARIHASLGMPDHAFDPDHPPVICSTGNRFLLVAMPGTAELAAIAPDFEEIVHISEALNLIGYYLWTPAQDSFAATTRMLAPRYGIDEEAATGMAAGPLACYLHDRCGIAGPRILIEQGMFMSEPSPSRLQVDLMLDADTITRLFVGGSARKVATRVIVLEPEPAIG